MIFWFIVGWLLVVLAAARITNALVYEAICKPLRDKLAGSFLGRMLECHWCAGFWVAEIFTACGTVAAVVLTPLPWLAVAAAFPIIWCSVAYGVGWLLDHED